MQKVQKQKLNNQEGFTLIELLVVISIIGLLASIILVSMVNARVKGRDVKRLADLRQARTALELYYADKGHYPIGKCSGDGTSEYMLGWVCFDCPSTNVIWGICDEADGSVTAQNINEALAKYIKPLKDPKYKPNDGQGGYWYASPNGVDFKIMSWHTAENLNNFDISLIDTYYCALPITSAGTCSSGSTAVGFWTPGGANY